VRRDELVALVDAAPGALRTLRGTLREWTHPERMGRLHARPDATIVHSLRVGLVTGWVAAGSATGAEATDAAPVETRAAVWFAAPDRWCVRYPDDGGTHLLTDGDRHWSGWGDRYIVRTAPVRDDPGPLARLLAPGFVLGPSTVVDPADDEVGGRPCVRADARRRAALGDELPVAIRAAGGLVEGAGDHRYWFDAEHGIVLRHAVLVDGDVARLSELLDVVVDESIPDDVFRPPSGARVQTDAEFLAERLAEAPHLAAAPSPEEEARLHVPTGPPPDDTAAAEAAVRHSYEHVNDTDASGRDLVNVQAGDGLAASVAEATRRYPAAVDSRWVVQHVRFLAPDQAAVWFAVEAGGRTLLGRRVGRAVRVDGRWVMEHATLAGVLAMAGVRVAAPGER
jgi:sarcosine oxidase gamma subunit